MLGFGNIVGEYAKDVDGDNNYVNSWIMGSKLKWSATFNDNFGILCL